MGHRTGRRDHGGFWWGIDRNLPRRLVEAEHWLQEGAGRGRLGSRFFGNDIRQDLGHYWDGEDRQAIACQPSPDAGALSHRCLAGPSNEQDCRAAYATKEDLLCISILYCSPALIASGKAIILPKGQGIAARACPTTHMLFNISLFGIDSTGLREARPCGPVPGSFAAVIDVFRNRL